MPGWSVWPQGSRCCTPATATFRWRLSSGRGMPNRHLPDRRTVLHRVATRRSLTTDGPWPAGESGRIVLIALAGTARLEQPDRLVHALFS